MDFDNLRHKTINQKVSIFIFLLMAISPIIHLAFGNWFDTCFNVTAVLSIFGLYLERNTFKITGNTQWFFIIMYLIYPFEIFLSQWMSWHWNIHEYLDQSRFILVIPIFLYLSYKKFNYIKILEYSLPLALILSFVTTKYFFRDYQYDVRFANNFSDPLAYGQIALSMSLLLIVSFLFNNNLNFWKNVWKVIGITFGFVISIKTQSRTGWIGILVVMTVLFWLYKNKIKQKYLLVASVSFILTTFAIFELIPIVHERIFEAYSEISNYPWSGGVAPETSVGLRITFYRIAWYYITHGHWYGWGDKGFVSLMNEPELLSFSTKQTIEFCYLRLFHNELITQTVRYGIMGVIGYSMVFIFPLIIFYRIFKKNYGNSVLMSSCILSIVFLITQISAGLTDEVINLKHMVMYFGLITAGLYATVVSEIPKRC